MPGLRAGHPRLPFWLQDVDGRVDSPAMTSRNALRPSACLPLRAQSSTPAVTTAPRQPGQAVHFVLEPTRLGLFQPAGPVRGPVSGFPLHFLEGRPAICNDAAGARQRICRVGDKSEPPVKDLDDRGQGQDLVSPRRPVRQIRDGAGRPRRVRAGRERPDRDLDQLSRHQDHADRGHDREGGRHRQAHRPVDERAGAAGQPRHVRLCPHRRAAPRRLCPAARPGPCGGAAVATRRPGQGAAAAVAHPDCALEPASIWRAIRASRKRSRAASATRRPTSPARGR